MTTRHTWSETCLQVTITYQEDGTRILVNKSEGLRVVEVDGERIELKAGDRKVLKPSE